MLLLRLTVPKIRCHYLLCGRKTCKGGAAQAEPDNVKPASPTVKRPWCLFLRVSRSSKHANSDNTTTNKKKKKNHSTNITSTDHTTSVMITTASSRSFGSPIHSSAAPKVIGAQVDMPPSNH